MIVIKHLCFLSLLVSGISLAGPGGSETNNFAAKKVAAEDEESNFGKVYGSVELRHHLNTYYDQVDKQQRQTPSFHARAKLGTTFRQELIDAYLTMGVVKMAHTQQVLQRRPEAEVDLYPLVGPYGQIIQYNLLQFPFEENEYEQSEGQQYHQGTVYTMGLAPTLLLPTEINGTKIVLKMGVDLWSQFFSRQQFRDSNREQDSRDHFGVAPEEGEEDEVEKLEDPAQRYYTQYMSGALISPAWARAASFSASLYYDIHYVPEYVSNESSEYGYVREETSHYRLRFKYQMTERASVINDFYHFHGGFFASKQRGDERRFRNIARLSYKL